MMTLACLAVAGFIMGTFFSSFTLLALCLAVALAGLVTALGVGFSLISLIVGLTLLQVGYLVGLTASTVLYAPRAAPVPTARV
jgi:hypothetical protein